MLTVNLRQQYHGVKYTETFAPVVSLYTIRDLLHLVLLNMWNTRQIDFVLAYLQLTIEYDLFMKLLMILIIKGLNQKTCFLQLMKNVCGQKQAGIAWNQYLVQGLLKIGSKQSDIDNVFILGGIILFLCVDNRYILI